VNKIIELMHLGHDSVVLLLVHGARVEGLLQVTTRDAAKRFQVLWAKQEKRGGVDVRG
jgi:hypothetical protein